MPEQRDQGTQHHSDERHDTPPAFAVGKVCFTELERSSDKDEIVTQTISFSCQLDTATS